MTTHILEIIISIINYISIFILVIGVILSFLSFLKYEFFKKDKKDKISSKIFIKNYLGTYILLSLETLICADIIETIMNPNLKDMVRLAFIVIIRTVISYFLNKEIKN